MDKLFIDWIKFNYLERELYEGESNNRYGFAVGQIERYLEFLLLIDMQHDCTVNSYKQIHKELDEKFGGYSGDVTPELGILLNSRREITLHLNYEIEAYHLFAKILLDTIFHFIEYYFGVVENIKLASHHDKIFAKYAEAKELSFNNSLQEKMGLLHEMISKYRNDEITHNKSRMGIYGLRSQGGAVRINKGELYSREATKHVDSSDIKSMGKEIDSYLNMVGELIANNREKRDKSEFQLKEES